MALSWNEIKDRALKFSKEWADTANEDAEAFCVTLQKQGIADYVYTEDTHILIIDNVEKKNDIFIIPKEELENVNNLNNLARGTYINDLYLRDRHSV